MAYVYFLDYTEWKPPFFINLMIKTDPTEQTGVGVKP
jgi:hypothetical protein